MLPFALACSFPPSWDLQEYNTPLVRYCLTAVTRTLAPRLKTESRVFEVFALQRAPLSPDLQEGSWGTRSPLAEEWGSVFTHTPYRTWRCHGVKCALLDRVCPQEFCFKFPCARSDNHYGSINPPSIPAFPCFRLHRGGKQHKQTAVFSWAEGKLVREVKVNNIPCSLQ